jgi:hypothetical protein
MFCSRRAGISGSGARRGPLGYPHAQTEKGYRRQNKIRDCLQLPERSVATVVYDPN